MYTRDYLVHVYETGPDGRLSPAGLLDYLQDIASAHAVQLGFGMEDLNKSNRMWVLSRLYAVITEWPAWEAQLTVHSWHKGIDKLFSLRDYRVTTATGRPVAAATSSWLTIDQTTRRIQRPDGLLALSSIAGPFENALLRNAEKLEPAGAEGRVTPAFPVRISDLDLNLHTNNVRYLKWVIDSYDLDFVLGHALCSVEVNYLAESRCGEEIVIRSVAGRDGFWSHSIVRVTDGVELARIRLQWRER